MNDNTNAQTVFQRYEIKYLISRKQKEKILRAMKPYMQPDNYGHSTIRNIYYDTDNYRLVRASLQKPVYKEKLRVRSYKTTDPSDEVFVELKKKFNDVVFKRRFITTQKTAEEYLAGADFLSPKTQITAEVDYFLHFYENLAPRVFLSYEREAYFTKEPGAFRVTFDENILWRETDLTLKTDVYGETILNPGEVLMEIKTSDSIPLWLTGVLSEENIRKTSFSKYGSAYQMILLREKGEVLYV
ncbi:MAG: polyphosphate polymerase domain-containing protein [Alistipes sp.]|nr:polyphosphate polymerase domain-containing protein [Alistipes sp.]